MIDFDYPGSLTRFYPGTQIPVTFQRRFTLANLGNNLLLWADGADLSTITKDGSDKISGWADKSGNGFNFIQNTSTNQPTYLAAAKNGLSIVRFNGSSSFMDSLLSIDYAVRPNVIIYIVYILNAGGATNQALYGQDNGGFDRFALLSHATLGASISTGSSGSPVGTAAVAQFGTTGAWRLVTITLQDSVSNGLTVAFNNSIVTTATESHSNSGLSIFRIGEIGSNNIFGKVDVAEVVITTTSTSSSAKNQLTGYLNKKWALGF